MITVVGLGLTAVGGWFVYNSYQRLRDEQAAARIDTAATAVRVALDRVSISVRAVRGLYAADMVTEDEFERFASPLAANEVLRGIGFLRRVGRADRERYETRFNAEPAKSLGIWENGPDGKPMRSADRAYSFRRRSRLSAGGGQPALRFRCGVRTDP